MTSMRTYTAEIAYKLAMAYICELLKIHNEIPPQQDKSINISSGVNMMTGTIDFILEGDFGDEIKNPVVKVQIVPDLLRSLNRGGKAYSRHIANIPKDSEIIPLLKEYYNTIRLIGIANKQKGR